MRRLLLGLLALAVTGLIAAGVMVLAQSKPNERDKPAGGPPGPAVRMPPPLVQTAPAVRREVPVEITVLGTVLPARRSIIHAGSPGRVTEFYVNEGDYVEPMQELVQLRLVTAEIERDAAIAVLEHRWQEFREMLAGYQPEEIEQARRRLAGAKVQEEWARMRYNRVVRAGPASRPEELDEVKANLEMATQNVAMAQAAYDLAVQGPRDEQKARARAAVDAAHAEVLRIEDEIWKKTLRAPFEGYVTAEYTEKGQWLNTGEAAVEIVELRELEVEVKVPERYVAFVREGQAVTVQVESLGLVGPQALIGRIVRVNPQVDPLTRTLPVKVRVANRIGVGVEPELLTALTQWPAMAAPLGSPVAALGQLHAATWCRRTVPQFNRPWIKAGQLAHVMWQADPQTVLLVPKDALVLASGRDPVVYVVEQRADSADGQPKPIARAVPVKMGRPFEDFIEVEGDLQPGAAVIIRGNERVRPGQEVRVTGAATSQKQ